MAPCSISGQSFNNSANQSTYAEVVRDSVLIHADQVFDGFAFRGGSSILVVDGEVIRVDTPAVVNNIAEKIIDLGDATLFPGFIKLRALSSLIKPYISF